MFSGTNPQYCKKGNAESNIQYSKALVNCAIVASPSISKNYYHLQIFFYATQNFLVLFN